MTTIDENQMEDITRTGIAFLRSITETHGSEQGMQLWEKMMDVLDPAIKGKIFFAMLTGNYNGNIVLHGISRKPYEKIYVIREVRGLTGMGLTQAKNLVESLEVGKSVTLVCPSKDRDSVVEALRGYGVIVT